MNRWSKKMTLRFDSLYCPSEIKTKNNNIMKNIFEKLNEKGICYAVGVALVTLKSEDAELYDRDYYDRDYYIIAAAGDKEQLLGLKFKDSLDDNYDVIERDLNEEEVSLFKGLHDDFIKVKHDENGRIYELKNKSFKKYYHNVWNGLKKKRKLKI